jgi:hypothetical protein
MDSGCANRDLVRSPWAGLLWWLPAVMLIGGLYWSVGRIWLWIPAFALAGSGCIVNAVRCGRLHCYITGPVFLLAAFYLPLFGFHVLPLQPEPFLLVVVVIGCAARLAEFSFGRYRDSRVR